MLRILWAGAGRDRTLAGLAERYAERIRRRAPVRIESVGAGRGSGPGAAARSEGQRLLSRVPAGSFLTILDAGGTAMESAEFARWLQDRLARAGGGDLIFALGGHEGLDAPVRSRADAALSLSAMTFTHEMARVLLLEQIYRALTILRGEPYHH